MVDWTDTDWTHALGTERLRLVRDALALVVDSPLAEWMGHEASADLAARETWTRATGRPYWPLTELERHAYL